MQGGKEQLCHELPINDQQNDKSSSTIPCKMPETSIVLNNESNETITPLTTYSDVVLSSTNLNCDNNSINQSRILVNTDDETKVLLNDGTLVTRSATHQNGGATTIEKINCDNFSDKIKLPKPILSNGIGAPTPLPRQIPKKSVSFDTDDEKIQKFITGEIIVDQQNPFKNDNAIKRAEFFSRNYQNIAQSDVALPNDDEFVTTEDVLKESKYVKTYIKNPDKHFQYDPNLVKKLRTEIGLENRKCIPVKIPKVPKTTNERIKDLKNKYSPLSKLKNGGVPSKTKIDRSKYPDLSEIKIKVGTDLEESLFNPEEVTLNARKFDARIKNTSFGSQDDLDDIADLTSTSLESVIENPNCSGSKADDELDGSELLNNVKQPKKTFTNTVNSREFQEYLKKKGLTLVPDCKRSNSNLNNRNYDTIANYRLEIAQQREMEEKKIKKPSVLQRWFPSRMFSKRRTTPQEPVPEPKSLYSTSEEDINRPNEIKRVILERKSFYGGNYTSMEKKKISSEPDYSIDKSGKYVIDDGSSSISSALTNAEEYHDTVVKSIAMRPVQKENYVDMKANKNNSVKIEPNSKDRNPAISRCTEQIIPKPAPRSLSVDSERKQAKIKPITRLKPLSGRNSVPIVSLSDRIDQIRNTGVRLPSSSAIPTPVRQKIDQPVLFESKSPDTRDGVVKPRVHRPVVTIVNQKSNHIKPELHCDLTGQVIINSPLQRSNERQSMDYKRPVENMYGNLTRAVSMNKTEIRKKNLSKQFDRPKLVPCEGIPAQIKIIPATNVGSNESQSKHILSLSKIPDVRVESPQICSTPIDHQIPEVKQNNDFYFHQKSNNIDKSAKRMPANNLDLDTYSWAKLRELKEQTDKELYRKQVEHSRTLAPNIYGKPSDRQENVYERLPSRDGSILTQNIHDPSNIECKRMPEHQQIKPLNQRQIFIQNPVENEAFIRHSSQRNTISGVYRPRDLKPINERSLNESRLETIPSNQILSQKLPVNYPYNNDYGKPVIEQPLRCQSAMGEIISRDSYGSVNNDGSSPIPVILRRKQTGTISREEIMKRLTEFYRKSTGKTPTKNMEEVSGRNSNIGNGSISGSSIKLSPPCDVSPNSYVSIGSSNARGIISSNRNSLKVAPQVPQRIQSLQSPAKHIDDQTSSLYAPIYKNYSTQSSSVSDILSSPSIKRISFTGSPNHQSPHTMLDRKQTYSDTDSVCIVEEHDKYASSRQTVPLPAPRNYVVMNSDQITPSQVLSYRSPSAPISKPLYFNGPYNSRQNMDIYGRIYPKDPGTTGQYGYVQLRHPQPGAQVSQIYFPANSGILANHIRSDGRVTPLILHAIPSQQFNGPKSVPKYTYDNNGRPNDVNAGGNRDIGKIIVLNNMEKLYRPIVVNENDNQILLSQKRQSYVRSGNHIVPYESESTSEAEEVQRILQTRKNEDDWQNEKARNQQNEQATDDRRRAAGRRDDPRRHTLGTDMLGYAQGQGTLPRAMDLEVMQPA